MIEQKDLELVNAILTRFVPDREVKVFGSRVTGRAWEFSDLDLVLLGDDPLPPYLMSDLKEAFTESDLPFKVDVLVWRDTTEDFREVIQSDMQPLPRLAESS